MADEPPPLELLHDGPPAGSTEPHDDRAQWHTMVRTGCAVIATAALVWCGLSINGLRSGQDQQICFTEIQYSMFSPVSGPRDETEQRQRLADGAEECGLTLLAESLRREG